MDYSEFLDTAVTAARRAQEVIMGGLGRLSVEDIGRKHAADFVTRIDRESENEIISAIREKHEGHAFLAEESFKETGPREFRWIIDPLDGTTNYIHQYPMFSISIALEHRADIVLGVVLDPLRQELFCAQKGRGATLNGRPLAVSTVDAPGACLITTGFPFRQKDKVELYLEVFKKVFLGSGDLRRAGSAALDLAHLAAGRCEGFFELGLSAWDIAAGSLLIREAGGVVTDFGGGGDYLSTGNVVAGNAAVHGRLLGVIRETFGGTVDR